MGSFCYVNNCIYFHTISVVSNRDITYPLSIDISPLSVSNKNSTFPLGTFVTFGDVVRSPSDDRTLSDYYPVLVSVRR